MKEFFTYAFSVLAVLSVLSCGEKEPEQGGQTNVDSRHLEISLSPSKEVSWEGGSVSLNIDANFTCKVDVDVDWITADASKTSTDKVKHFLVSANEGSASRTAEFRVSDASDRFFVKTVSLTQSMDPNPKTVLHIVDKAATEQTKALFANLWTVADKGFMFGHHDDLWYGRHWYNEPGASDTKEVCGDYPGVFSVDFAAIMDNRYRESENEIRRRVVLEAYARGEVIIACAHLNNPLTGGDSWDNSRNDVVKSILTEGNAVRTKYLTWLDRLADFCNDLKDENGELVPVIFRPYHEHTQSWSWWGSSCTTATEFVDFWQMTVKYLRDTKGVHNLLYAVSPQMDGNYSNAQERILYRWPGDDYVDFIGMDCYHGTNSNAFSSNLEAIQEVSKAKMKPCGVTETGIESFSQVDYWSRQIMAPTEGKRISMVVMWRNKYVGTNEADKHYYSVFPGHPSEEDFRKMYASPRTLFSKDLPDMYTLPAQIAIK